MQRGFSLLKKKSLFG